jgi:hypothetical protein
MAWFLPECGHRFCGLFICCGIGRLAQANAERQEKARGAREFLHHRETEAALAPEDSPWARQRLAAVHALRCGQPVQAASREALSQ